MTQAIQQRYERLGSIAGWNHYADRDHGMEYNEANEKMVASQETFFSPPPDHSAGSANPGHKTRKPCTLNIDARQPRLALPRL